MSNHLPGYLEGYCDEGYIKTPAESTWAVGLDLGTVGDFTCFSAVQRLREPLAPNSGDGWCSSDLRQKLGPTRYLVRHLQRFKLGLTYSEIADLVLELIIGPLRGVSVVTDGTGVGKAVVELLEAKGILNVTPVVITSGHDEGKSEDGRTLHIPKGILISHLQAALHLGELKIAPGLDEAQAFAKELGAFRVTRTDHGNLSMNARSGAHDDILLSVALALFWLRRKSRNSWSVEARPF